MAALTSIRATVKAAILAAIQADLPGVQVVPAFPQTMEKETVIIGDTRGRQDPAAVASNRVRRDDSFTVEVFFGAKTQGQDPTEAETRAEELFAVLEEALATDPRLGLSTTSGLLWARMGDVDGPDPCPADEGYDAWIRAEVVCKTRLT